jgi:hypothetical protein
LRIENWEWTQKENLPRKARKRHERRKWIINNYEI